MSRPAAPADTTNSMKKSACPPRCHGSAISPRSIASTCDATSPPPRFAPATTEPRPEPGKGGCQQEDEPRVDGLEPRRRYLEAGERAVRAEIGEEVQTRARLLEGEPEDGVEEHEDEDRRRGPALVRPESGDEPDGPADRKRGEHERHAAAGHHGRERGGRAHVVEEREERGDGDPAERARNREVRAARRGPSDVAEEVPTERQVEREAGEHAD